MANITSLRWLRCKNNRLASTGKTSCCNALHIRQTAALIDTSSMSTSTCAVGASFACALCKATKGLFSHHNLMSCVNTRWLVLPRGAPPWHWPLVACPTIPSQANMRLLLQGHGGVSHLPLPLWERVHLQGAADQARGERPRLPHDRGVQPDHR